MSKIEDIDIVYGSDCLSYVEKAIGLHSFSPSGTTDSTCYVDGFPYNMGDDFGGCQSWQINRHDGAVTTEDYYADQVTFKFSREVDGFKFNHSGRVCGLILGENDDGSYKIALLGNENLNYGNGDHHNTDVLHFHARMWANTFWTHDNGQFKDLLPITPNIGYNTGGSVQLYIEDHGEEINDYINFQPRYENVFYTVNFGTILNTGIYRGTPVRDLQTVITDMQLTTNKNNTLVIGANNQETHNVCIGLDLDELSDPTKGLGGDYQAFFYYLWGKIRNTPYTPATNMLGYNTAEYLGLVDTKLYGHDNLDKKNHAFHFKPTNLILTRSESAAKAYVNSGTLPDDAFLYPFDWDNLPTIEEEQDEGDDEDGSSGVKGDPSDVPNPIITPNMLNNNNLYWLQSGQLEEFFRWFWQDAGEVAELDDLWKKIEGLYADLKSAVVNVRYYPAFPADMGGVTSTDSIIVGMISKPMQGIQALAKGKPPRVKIGEITITPQYDKPTFLDFSPHTEIKLFLPFHGWIDLDVDVLMSSSANNLRSLVLYCVFDYESGTVQYMVYVKANGSEYLINTAVAKMCVDMPFTLQSKADKDTALFQNITQFASSLVGAAASAAGGSPVGLTMAMQGFANMGQNSAPLKIYGSQGEAGSYRVCNRPFIVYKRPSYNRPKLYASRVGYPCNQSGQLGKYSSSGKLQKNFKGFTVVENPTITFKGKTVNSGETHEAQIYPMNEEVTEIYDYLRQGVIL